jgi:yeast amino acid transporter
VFLKGNWNTADFITTYLPLFLFPAMYIGAKLVTGVSLVKPQDMDFQSDIEEIEADECVLLLGVCRTTVSKSFDRHDEPPPKNMAEAFWAWLVGHSPLLSHSN